MAAPNTLVELAKALELPGDALQGKPIIEKDVTKAALAVNGLGATSTTPSGSLAISITKHAKNRGIDWSPPDVYHFMNPAWNKSGHSVLSVYRNPSESQVARAVKNGKPMRVLFERETGDFIVWPGNEGLHADIMKELRLSDDTADNLGVINSFEDLKKLVDWVNKK